MRSRLLCWLAAVAALSTPALAQDVKTNQGISITLHGIVDATFYADDALFQLGGGQKANYVVAKRPHWVHGGDIQIGRAHV